MLRRIAVASSTGERRAACSRSREAVVAAAVERDGAVMRRHEEMKIDVTIVMTVLIKGRDDVCSIVTFESGCDGLPFRPLQLY